ncbi:hypothetical protein [Alienimonas californiensis]|uniref:IRE (Iron responsive element) n=1 Tax=Alienimonas californiensis TaxID=2527989 RepID=A0A517PAY2_9PLAN|nr:hypothetical protein [Alienimonas californiensis]QDT16529.1 hypothetical protein CA12_26340 [Alienimonas californiensis]
MNEFTPRQRKIAYAVALLLLSIPIIWLGRPASVASADRAEGDDVGGKLSQKRDAFTLGEASLGNVDPSSSTMNLVLFGLRGVATNVLWQDAMDAKEKKDWARLRSDVDSITLLQPHYEKVWDFQGWNLAYNVAAEWDGVPDRWYWVKEGTKFVMDGVDRNSQSPDLRFKVGQILGQKIGNADEKNYYRRYWNEDPDVAAFGGQTDPELNRDPAETRSFPHHHLASRAWYQYSVEANDNPKFPRQSQMIEELFVSKPAEAQRQYAEAIEEAGEFADAPAAWTDARRDWVEGLGKRRLPSYIGATVFVEADEDDIRQMAEEVNARLAEYGIERRITPEEIQAEIGRKRNSLNYDFWKQKATLEARPETVKARRLVYEGKLALVSDEPGAQKIAAEKLWEGLELWDQVLRESPLGTEDTLGLSERMTDLVYLRDALQFTTGVAELPEDAPLYDLWQNSDPSAREAAIDEFEYERRNNIIRG